MQKITIQTYTYDELEPKAKQRALDNWLKVYDMPFLQSMLNDECNEMIKEYQIKCTSNHPVCLYSLDHCQGDGLMFEGNFIWEGHDISIKHEGRYYHSHSANINIPSASERKYDEFQKIYHKICKRLEKYGYDLIEEETSEAHFEDMCRENDYKFLKDGDIAPIE